MFLALYHIAFGLFHVDGLLKTPVSLGSVEKAKEVYALFSASLMTSAAAIPSLIIPADSAAQPAVFQEEGPRDSGSQHAETVSRKADKEEAVHERPEDGGQTSGGTEVETEQQGDGNPNSEGKKDAEGETPVVESTVEGETPVVVEVAEGETPVQESMAEGETPMETGDETPMDFRGVTPEPMEEGATPSDVRGKPPFILRGQPRWWMMWGTPRKNLWKKQIYMLLEYRSPLRKG